MTKRALAEYLRRVYETLDREADRLDPKRKRASYVVQKLDAASHAIAGAYGALTGQHPGAGIAKAKGEA